MILTIYVLFEIELVSRVEMSKFFWKINNKKRKKNPNL